MLCFKWKKTKLLVLTLSLWSFIKVVGILLNMILWRSSMNFTKVPWIYAESTMESLRCYLKYKKLRESNNSDQFAC